MPTTPAIELSPFIDRLTTNGFKSVREADGYFLHCANAVYDTYEFLTEIKDSKTTPDIAIDTLAFTEKFEPQLARLLDVLDETDFDTKNFDRLYQMLLSMEEDLPKLKKQLHKIALQSSK